MLWRPPRGPGEKRRKNHTGGGGWGCVVWRRQRFGAHCEKSSTNKQRFLLALIENLRVSRKRGWFLDDLLQRCGQSYQALWPELSSQKDSSLCALLPFKLLRFLCPAFPQKSANNRILTVRKRKPQRISVLNNFNILTAQLCLKNIWKEDGISRLLVAIESGRHLGPGDSLNPLPLTDVPLCGSSAGFHTDGRLIWFWSVWSYGEVFFSFFLEIIVTLTVYDSTKTRKTHRENPRHLQSYETRLLWGERCRQTWMERNWDQYTPITGKGS